MTWSWYDQRVTPEEFAAKVEYEGLDYAFNEYGLSENDLERDDNPDLYDAVQAYNEALRRIDPLRHKIEDLVEDLLEED